MVKHLTVEYVVNISIKIIDILHVKYAIIKFISSGTFVKLNQNNDTIICVSCSMVIFPFFPISRYDSDDSNDYNPQLKDSVKLFFQGINNYVDKSSETTYDELPLNCKYVHTD